MGSVTPVTYRASSEASHSTALEMSTGSTHGIGQRVERWNLGASTSRVRSASGRSEANSS